MNLVPVLLSLNLPEADVPLAPMKRPIGWVENVNLVVRDINGKTHAVFMKAKVDTGAKTSSLHATEEAIVTKNGQKYVRFNFMAGAKKLQAEYPILDARVVKSSDGDAEPRHFVEVEVCLGNVMERILVTLNDRGSMQYPLLLGRRFLENKYLVDSGSKYLLGKPTIRQNLIDATLK